GPAHPARINLAQEPLGFRRKCFSHFFSLLMSAFSLPIPPAVLTDHLHRRTERSATTSSYSGRTNSHGVTGLVHTARHTMGVGSTRRRSANRKEAAGHGRVSDWGEVVTR
ncbi:unnamed protein product, partial [Pararhodospirillum photometricum DSM 122]